MSFNSYLNNVMYMLMTSKNLIDFFIIPFSAKSLKETEHIKLKVLKLQTK